MYTDDAGLSSPEHNVAEATSRTIRAKKREISIRYAWQASQRNGEKLSKSRMLTLVRMRELERLYAARQCLVDDDAGREYLEIAAHHIAQLRGEVEKHIVQWCQRWAPWMPSAEAAAIAQCAAAKPRKWKAASLGDELNLTPEERDALSITTFRPAGWTKKHIDKANAKKRAAREKERRRNKAAAEGRILRAKPGRPRKTAAGTNIRAHQGIGNGGHAFPCQGEPSGSAVTQQDVGVVPFRVKPNPEPAPATATAWREAA
jgi:hypothetical protein